MHGLGLLWGGGQGELITKTSTGPGRQHLTAGLAVGHLGGQAIAGALGGGYCGLGAGAARAEELLVVSVQNLSIAQDRVVGRVVLGRRGDQGVSVLQVGLQLLGLDGQIEGLLGLSEQGVFHHAGVVVQQGRGFGSEVLENFEALVTEASQEPVDDRLDRSRRLLDERLRLLVGARRVDRLLELGRRRHHPRR